MITLNFNKSEVNFWKHPKLQTNLKLKRNFIFSSKFAYIGLCKLR